MSNLYLIINYESISAQFPVLRTVSGLFATSSKLAAHFRSLYTISLQLIQARRQSLESSKVTLV